MGAIRALAGEKKQMNADVSILFFELREGPLDKIPTGWYY